MAWAFENINAYINRLVRSEIHSKQVAARPLFYFLTNRNQYQVNKLLRPYAKPNGGDKKNPNDNWRYGVSMGGNIGLAQRLTTLGSLGHEFRYQTDDPDGAENVAPGGTTGSASQFSEDLVGTAETRWTKTNWNLKIRNSSMQNARGKTKIASMIEEAMSFSFNQSFADRQTSFWSGTLTQAQQDKKEWEDGLLGLTHLVSDGTSTGETTYNIIGRVDRSSATNGQDKLKSTVNLAADLKSNNYIPTLSPTLELIRKMKNTNAIGGVCNIDPLAGDLVITTPELFNNLADEAEAQNNIYLDPYKIPETGKTVGFQYPCIMYGNTKITYDPDCPSGHLYLLSTGSFVYEVAAGMNYKVQKWTNKAETEEGGDDYSWTKLWLKDRLTCRQPWLNVKTTGLIA